MGGTSKDSTKFGYKMQLNTQIEELPDFLTTPSTPLKII
jgi:hypothetical protein